MGKDTHSKGSDVMEDSRIIGLFFERSEQALEELDRKYGAAVKKTAANILSDRQDAEECVNDTYLRVWNSIPPQKPNPLVSYVCKIARNLALDRYRSNTAEKRNGNLDLVLEEMEECIPSNMSVETELEAKELTQEINRFLSALPKDDRFFFVRRYWYGDSVADLAAMTGGSANRISVRLFRIREKLRNTLTKEGLIA
jgi:RNA polymerase sigma-70 factor (ECF subfamily)